MFINKPKYLFKRLVRTADFPMFQDMGGQLSNRGLQWTRFQEGSFANSKLPEDMVQQISLTRSVFNESFSKFFTKTPEAFRGMIFTVYAPNFIGDDLSADAQLSTEQQSTLEFVRNNNIVLPSQEENAAKQIGTDWWFSHYAYAWKDQFPQGIEDVGASQSNKVVTVNNPELARSKGIDYGPVQVAPTSSGGYGVFINTDAGGSESGLIPMLGIQSPQNMDKFFMSPGEKFKGLRPNGSNIILPEGPSGNRVEYARQPRPRNKSGLSTEELNQIDNIKQSINDSRQEGTLWQLRLADDGTLFAKNVADGEEAPLSRSIVEQLIKPQYFKSMQGVVPAKTRSDQVNEAGVGNMGRWKVSDEVKVQIMGDFSKPYSNPRSIAALQQLRKDINEMRGENRVELNGYHIITIGPKFSNPQNMGEGQTTSSPGFVTPETMVDPLDQSVIPIVERGTKWVVLVDEYQGEKLKSQGRKGNPKKKSAEFEDLHKAFEWAKGQYGGDTNAFDVGERTIRSAMKALEKSISFSPDENQNTINKPNVNQMPNKSINPDNGGNILNSPIDNQDNENGQDSRIASMYLRKMIKRANYK